MREVNATLIVDLGNSETRGTKSQKLTQKRTHLS